MKPDLKGRILVVDDEPSNVELIAGVFENVHDVQFALSGRKALELAASNPPDVILLDILLPEMDGYQILEHLKNDQHTADIPVIFITSLGDTEAETRGLEAGARDYITKPINSSVLKVRVKNQMELKRSRDQLARMAHSDGLTGLANRNRFYEILKQEHARHMRSGKLMGIIMLDIDYFKLFNDTYGHVQGDECLRRVAEAIASGLQRSTDLAARYGGEEFACILPEVTSQEGIFKVAQRIQQNVSDLQILHAQSEVSDHVTISQGLVITCCTADTTLEYLVSLADQELYRAKQQGRNRICMTMNNDC
ncbi:diguanylate cyclase [Desulfonatronospira sp.]|uniref:diguanylate cyclase domain-containing protein n=1 Tax=Desulfonatronospira sp. TaxID=1962951 RepID=UPI0025C654CD|nr:diguanylate cyclase [Desulfonatronospira sp.]